MRWRKLIVLFLIFENMFAESLTIAQWNANMSKKGPGLLIKELLENSSDFENDFLLIQKINPDVLILTNVDQDPQNWSADILSQSLKLPYYFTGPTNRGYQSGHDLDQDEKLSANDAWGYGIFRGNHSMVILSKYPIKLVHSFSNFKWSHLENAIPPTIDSKPYYSDKIWDEFPLFSSGLWQVEIADTTFIIPYLTPPAFDGEVKYNQLRNRAELSWISNYISGASYVDDTGTEAKITAMPFAIVGTLNVDPERGNGHKATIDALLKNPKINDFNENQTTVDWRDLELGEMRVSYILPSHHHSLIEQGKIEMSASNHDLIWQKITR